MGTDRSVPAASPDAIAVETVFPPVPESVSAARRFVAACLARDAVKPQQQETAGLAVSELVTNALLHGTGPIRVGVTVEPRRLRVTVVDEGPPADHPRAVVAAQPYDAGLESGRGLLLVGALTHRWAASPPSGAGTTVWFELDRV
jgi:anti-sigma regulatory factor (Ser/Thr protein kinase)